MTWTQLRGRPVAMPCDPTPLRGGHIDTQTRVAWLLRTNRLAGGLGTAPSFAATLAAHGAVVGPSALSRYETGGESAPPRVIRAYELALDLPAGQLVGVSQGLRRMFGPTSVPGVLPELSRTAISEALGGLETRVADGTSTGLDWLAIAQLLTCSSGMLLPPSMLTDWVGRLVGQTMRSVHHAYTTPLQALSLLVADPQTCRLVWDQIHAETGRPGAQGVVDVLAVLGDVRDPGLVGRLLQRLAEAEGAGQWGIALALLTQIVTGRLPGGLVATLSDTILAMARRGAVCGLPAFLLAQRISAPLTQQVIAALGCDPTDTDPGARVQHPAQLARYVAAGTAVSGLDDPMLERLLRESLSADFLERRRFALRMLSASPYREVLADTAIDVLHDQPRACATTAALTMLAYLAGPAQREDLLALLASSRVSDRGRILRALTHSGGVPPEVSLLREASEPAHAKDAVYAAGMSARRDLAAMATSGELAGTPAQCSAGWWLSAGSAVTDATDRRTTGTAAGRGGADRSMGYV